MIIGIVQNHPVFGDVESNQKQLEEIVGSTHADLWVMSELALTGYEFQGRQEVDELAEEVPNGKTATWLRRFCNDRNCHAIIGLPEREGQGLYNSSMFMSPKGVISRYRKLHLFDKETERFDRGNIPLSVQDIGHARIGVMICFDWRFPEVARTLTLLGAQIIAHPSNLVLPYAQKAMITRTLENHVFAMTANRIGTEDRDGRVVHFTGVSQIVGARGDVLASAPRSSSGVITAEIDPAQADDKHINIYNDLMHERRTEFYLAGEQAAR
ncbi:acyltransferase [candidate division KSB1 bacterium]|nr:acyltransferase [candidate division KSB1 bacterium]